MGFAVPRGGRANELADIELTVVSLGALMRGSSSAAAVLASIAEAYRVPNIAGVLRTRG
jgi:hypothetical protein